jgi:hypothetical protein
MWMANEAISPLHIGAVVEHPYAQVRNILRHINTTLCGLLARFSSGNGKNLHFDQE